MYNISEETRAEIDRAVDAVSIGMLVSALKMKRYYDILVAADVPAPIVEVAIKEWCVAEARLSVEPVLHQIFAQQHQKIDEASHED